MKEKIKKRLIEFIIAKFIPGYHLHRDPPRRKGLQRIDKETPVNPAPEELEDEVA